jgi:lipoprotein NlpD
MTRNEKRMLIESKWAGALVLAAAMLAGCSTTLNRAPVEDRSVGTKPAAAPTPPAPAPIVAQPAADPARVPPGAENAGKPGYYTVKGGDTLIRIGLENGQNWKDLLKWNNLENPNIIEVGQVLRVLPPGVDPNAASSKPVANAKVDTRPLDPKAAAPAASAASAVAPSATAAAPATPAAREGNDELSWSWPAVGAVIVPFDEGKVNGLSIGGKAGDPVTAAADGRVIYAGSGVRGYGNLIILKHNNTYLTAYAHNQTLLVKEDQAVRRGQKIAEMGSTSADSVRLHFEIRKLGKAIDPAKVLPPR